jgi:REP element-mobilizing transposase RayT
MINSTKVLQEVEDNQMELEATEVISKIFLIKQKIEDTPVNEWKMDQLVDYIFTLTKIMPNLSDLKDYAYIKAEALGEEYKSSVRDQYIHLKKTEKITDGMARAQAEATCDEIKANELKAGHQARWLKSLYDDCSRIINFTQSKIKSMSDERIMTNIDRK